MAPRSITRVLLAGATLASVAAIGVTAETGAASGASSVNWGKVTHLTKSGATSMSALVKAAKKEGHLNVVALPDNWANYGNIIKDFKKKYGIKINSENPEEVPVRKRSRRSNPTRDALATPTSSTRRNELRGDRKV